MTAVKTDIKMTRGAWMQVERILRHRDPYTTNERIVKASKLWNKIKKINPMTKEVDDALAPGTKKVISFDKNMYQGETESNVAFQKRVTERQELMEVWKGEEVSCALTDKERKLIRIGVDWAVKHRSDRILPDNDEHNSMVIATFVLADDNEDDEDSADVDGDD